MVSSGNYLINKQKTNQTTKHYKPMTFLNSRYKNQFLNSQFTILVHVIFTIPNSGLLFFYIPTLISAESDQLAQCNHCGSTMSIHNTPKSMVYLYEEGYEWNHNLASTLIKNNNYQNFSAPEITQN